MEETRGIGEAPALRAGRLEGISLPDLLWALCRRRTTGVLHLSRDETRKTVCIEDGRIVFASSNDPDDRLGELFLKRGSITLQQLEDALRKIRSGTRLGTLLVEADSLGPEELVDGVLSQVRSIVLDLFTWADGEYRFEEGPLPTDEVIKLEIKTPELLLRGIREVRSFGRIRRSVGAPHQFYGLGEGAGEILAGLGLTAGEDLLIEKLREREASVESLCREVFLSNFEIYQTLWGLKILGVIEERECGPEETSEAALEGELGDEGFGGLLVRLGRENRTGVLYLSQKELERTFHIQDGRCVFATSSVPDDGLVAYLLRRGVISLRDREETAKRLLSNKRVGTILRELGVIDEEDLHEMVRQQISEIVYDTFCWDDAHFAFVSGPLPSNEEITLEENLNRLVAVGVRRVTSWSRVQEGCGGLDTPLALLPSYLDVLDAMNAGPEEWGVLASLREVTTPRRICSDSTLGAFRICQILWVLRVLGAVEIRPASELAEEQPVLVPDAAERPGPRMIEVVDLDRKRKPAAEEPAPAPDSLEQEDHQAVPPVVETAAEPDEIVPEWITEPERDLPADRPPEEHPEPPETAGDFHAVTPDELAQPVPEASGDDSNGRADADRAEEAAAPDETPASAGEELADFPHDGYAGETQILSRAMVEASLQHDEQDEYEERDEHEEHEEHEEHDERQAHGEHEEALDEPAEADATQVIPREVVEGVLSEAEAADADEVEADEMDAFEPPVDLDRTIQMFNTIQRLVYRTIRSEVGAGAVNFIRTCCRQLGPETVGSLQGADLHADGSWNAEGLRKAVVAGRIEDPWAEYQKLIGVEIELLRWHIGEARVLELQQQVAQVEEGSARNC